MLTQHARPLRSSVLLQMHFTSRLPQEPNEVPTQLVAQEGRPGICATARVDSRATAVRVIACMFAVRVWFDVVLGVVSIGRRIWICMSAETTKAASKRGHPQLLLNLSCHRYLALLTAQ